MIVPALWFLGHLNKQLTEPWLLVSESGSLVDVEEIEGVALIGNDGWFTVYTGDGKVSKRIPMSKSKEYLGYSPSRGTLMAPSLIAYWADDQGAPQQSLGHRVFAQHGSLFVQGDKMHIFSRTGDFISDPFSSYQYSAFGVNSKKTCIGQYRTVASGPVIDIFRRNQDSWVRSGTPFIPFFYDQDAVIGYPSLIPGFNDLRMIDDKYCVFIGRFSGFGMTGTAEFLRANNKKPSVDMVGDPSIKKRVTAYLLLCDLESGRAIALASLSIAATSESPLAKVGTLSTSFDEQSLYLLGARGIYRFSSKDLENAFESRL